MDIFFEGLKSNQYFLYERWYNFPTIWLPFLGEKFKYVSVSVSACSYEITYFQKILPITLFRKHAPAFRKWPAILKIVPKARYDMYVQYTLEKLQNKKVFSNKQAETSQLFFSNIKNHLCIYRKSWCNLKCLQIEYSAGDPVPLSLRKRQIHVYFLPFSNCESNKKESLCELIVCFQSDSQTMNACWF